MPASTTQLLLQSRFAPHFSIQPLPAGGDATPVCPTIRDFLEVDPFEVSSSKIAVEGSSLIAKGSCCSSSGGMSCCSWLKWNTLHNYYEFYIFWGNIVAIIVRSLWILCWSSPVSLYGCHSCLLVFNAGSCFTINLQHANLSQDRCHKHNHRSSRIYGVYGAIMVT